jgi:hypothetical protein
MKQRYIQLSIAVIENVMIDIDANIWDEEEEQYILFVFFYCTQQVANERIYRNHGDRNQSNIDLGQKHTR